MQEILPDKIRQRTGKTPFSPDYPLRYERDKPKAANAIRTFSESSQLGDRVDFQKVIEALDFSPDYRFDKPMRVDYASQFLVPYALYLCYFLDSFGHRP